MTEEKDGNVRVVRTGIVDRRSEIGEDDRPAARTEVAERSGIACRRAVTAVVGGVDGETGRR
jgi:stage III sporulation protein SpoIIIAA